MRRTLVPCVFCLVTMVSLPAATQTTEWRFALRLTALNLNAETGPILDTGTSMVCDDTGPAFNFEGQYMVADAWGVAFSIAPAPVDFDGQGGELAGQKLATMWYAPMTLTVRYEFQLMSDFQPYVGAGVNIGWLFASRAEPAIEDIGVDNLSANAAIGLAAEIGLNYNLSPTTFATFDIKYMDLDIETDLESGNDDVLERVRIEGSPWEIGLGVGWRF